MRYFFKSVSFNINPASLSGRLSKDMRDRMERVGVCISCHVDVPSGKTAYRIISRVGSVLGLIPKTDLEHQTLIGRAMLLAASIEIFGTVALGIVGIVLIFYFARRRPSK